MSSPLTLPFSSKPITHGKFRLERYSSSIGNPAQTASGALTWNDNGSLKRLVINDPFNPPNSQTCNYTHDDLSRISNVNCGTAWQQAFGFDVFGNLTKTGSLSFTPTYAAATNRINGGGYPAVYDNNGNLTNDGLGKTFAWNADNNPRTLSNGSVSITVIYDALGRAVENQNGSSYTEIVYGPDGSKLALMNGTTLVKAFVPLPGGGQAVYTASGLAYYRHADWLGSSRLASTPSRTLYFSGAYAPYGEDYAKTGTTDLSFTGQNQDTMNGLYDFLYRRYSPVQGRWMSPDPAGLAVADPMNPQTWNRYGYVINNPMNLVDPLGLRLASFWWEQYACEQWYWFNNMPDYMERLCSSGPMSPREREEPIPRDFWERSRKRKPPANNGNQMNGFKNCVANADAVKNKELLNASALTAAGGLLILAHTAIAYYSLPTLLKNAGHVEAGGGLLGGAEAAGSLVDAMRVPAFFVVPGYAYGKGIAALTQALNKHDLAIAQCQADFGYPNVP